MNPIENRLHLARQRAPEDYARLKLRALPGSGRQISYFELGDPQGAPLLCLHGLSLSGYVFDQYHQHFADQGIRAIAPCLLGGMAATSDPQLTLDALCSDLVELLDALGIGRFDMIGFSWGTLPELALIARVPQRIGRAGLLGPMLPMKFFGPQDAGQLKSDVRLSLRMVRFVPSLHRALMGLVCRLPVSALVDQFKDPSLSAPEAAALAAGSAFRTRLARCLAECVSTGSGFFTQGWRMVLDEPGYALGDLAGASRRIDLRLYIGEHDNVHLPAFADRIAAACGDVEVDAAEPKRAQAQPLAGLFRRRAPSIWMVPGAGRMACLLYFKETLDHLMSDPAPAFDAEPPPPVRHGAQAVTRSAEIA